MNLWLRLLVTIIGSIFRPRIGPADTLRLSFRVWPHDLDTSLHMNNGRYLTIMDLGRADMIVRTGLWRAVLRERWTPVVSAAKIRFRRELRPFRPFVLETRMATWAGTSLVMEQRLVSRSRTGDEIVNAVALLRVGLYDRKTRSFVAAERLLREIGVSLPSPEPSPEVAAFLEAEAAMKRAA
ncbi:MAG TPA: thioesterase family protein [Microvirga sp.]|jgi:acyl-CoA thioesterase FadM|nr:thioesterase family protein [Microvirga sp.]